MLSTAKADIAVFGELKLAAFSQALFHLLRFQEELVVLSERDDFSRVIYDTNVHDCFLQSSNNGNV